MWIDFPFLLCGYLAFAALANTKCISYPAEMVRGYKFLVLHCSTAVEHSENSHPTRGYFQIGIENNSIVPAFSKRFYQGIKLSGRIVGPIITELVFTLDILQLLWRSYYYLPFGGGYRANIEVRYLNFSHNDYEYATVYSTQNEVLRDAFFEVQAREKNKLFDSINHTKECTVTTFSRGGFWKSLVPLRMHPKWLLDEGFLQVPEAQKENIATLADKLLYQPKSCHIKRIEDVKHCKFKANAREICFVGDSQMRHMAGTIYGIFEENATFFQSPFNQKTDKMVYLNSHMHFAVDNWVDMKFTEEQTSQLARCSAILLNFGQWHLSYATWIDLKRGPYLLPEFVELVNKTLHSYLRLFSAKLFYLGTMPFGQAARLYIPNHPEKDHRNDVVLREFNTAGMAACRRVKGARCINLFEMGNVLRDLSYDLCHFKAPVGTQMALAVLTMLCNDE